MVGIFSGLCPAPPLPLRRCGSCESGFSYVNFPLSRMTAWSGSFLDSVPHLRCPCGGAAPASPGSAPSPMTGSWTPGPSPPGTQTIFIFLSSLWIHSGPAPDRNSGLRIRIRKKYFLIHNIDFLKTKLSKKKNNDSNLQEKNTAFYQTNRAGSEFAPASRPLQWDEVNHQKMHSSCLSLVVIASFIYFTRIRNILRGPERIFGSRFIIIFIISLFGSGSDSSFLTKNSLVSLSICVKTGRGVCDFFKMLTHFPTFHCEGWDSYCILNS